jgi:hypothetical protein
MIDGQEDGSSNSINEIGAEAFHYRVGCGMHA